MAEGQDLMMAKGWALHGGRVGGRAGWRRDVELNLRVKEQGELQKRSWRFRGSAGVGKDESEEHGTKAREGSHLQAEKGEGSEVGSG